MVKLPFRSAAVLAGLLATWTAAQAQEKPLTTTKDHTDTVNIFVTGSVDTDYVHRAHPITAFTDSFSNLSGAGNPLGSSAENTFEGEVAIRFTAELTDKVTAVVEIGTRRTDGDPAPGPGGINHFGEGQALPIRLREAHLDFPTVFVPELRAQAGM